MDFLMSRFSNLKIWLKLVLFGLIVAAPIVIPIRYMWTSITTLGTQVAEKELHGAAYLQPLQALVRHLQFYRLATAATLSGDQALRPKVEAAAREIDNALRAVDEADAAHGKVLDVSAKWASLKEQVRTLISSKTTSAPAAYRAQTQVIADLLAFIEQIGITSSLAADADPDSHYLMDATTYAIPEAAELLSKLAAQSMGPAVQRTIDPDQRDDLLKQFALVNYYIARLRDGYAKAYLARESLKAEFDAPRAATEKAAKGLLDQLENEFILTREDVVSMSATTWFETTNTAVNSFYDLYDKTLPALNGLLQKRIDRLHGEMMSPVFMILLVLVLVSLLGFIIVRDITVPLGNAVEAAKRIAAGDLTANVQAVERGDEIGVLTNAFDNMIRTLRSQIQSLTGGIQSLTATTGEIIVALTEVVAGATQAATAVNEAATTAEEVKQTARLASERSQEVAGSAHQAVRVAQEGERSVDDAVDGMNKVREQMESIAESVVKLGEQSRAIGEIIAAVSDLAEQSNLLAVNASIEAAKAGEHGKGFAIVAQEVKNLATQSKQATAQVRQILNDIQKAAGVAVMVTEQGTRSAEAGVRQSILAGESIRSLAKNIADAAQSVTQITVSSQQQLVGMDQVAGAMDSIREAANHNVESMRQIENAVQNLGEVCANLQSLAGRYRLAGAAA